MKTFIALALLPIIAGCGNPADSDPMYLRAVATRNGTMCSWPENIPRITTFRKLLPADAVFEKLMREKIEIVKREDAELHPENDEVKIQQLKLLKSLFSPEAIAQGKREERDRPWDLAARTFYSDQNQLDRSELGMNNATDKMNNALRLFHDDRQYYYPLTNKPLDEYVAGLASDFRQDCESYLTLAKTLAIRDEKLPKLREEPKKPWLNPRLHLPCAISETAGCTE